jgi:hypothetical protein
MFSGQERRKHPRPKQAVGEVSRFAQRRVESRVMEIMARRDAADPRNSPSAQLLPLRRLTRRFGTKRS